MSDRYAHMRWLHVRADEFLSTTKCVLERVHNGKFRETQRGAIFNLIKKKKF